ncbi:MAG: hypothetical protein DRQ55_13380 [Planctomycetota bacterium]|nr:MAG: hypothetical protein DRQ55_13380 [Planctomycetota bacterium]
MTLLLQDLRVPLDVEGASPADLASHRLGVRLEDVRVVRKSLDARAGREPVFIYTLEIETSPELEDALLQGKRRRQLRQPKPAPPAAVPPDDRAPLPGRPVIVGSGPAGLFAAWGLVRAGFRPLLLERGPDVTARGVRWHAFLKGGAFDPECNLLFGEGGAGTFSDGKLTTRIKDPRVGVVLDVLAEHGAPESVRWLAKPHVGSNALPAIIRRLRRGLQAAGAEVRFDTRVDDLIVRDDRVLGVRCGDETIDTGALVLGVGHSARDTLGMLLEHGVQAEAKPFQLGLRIEHPQALVERWQYGRSCGHPALPAAEYSLSSRDRSGARMDVHSFCMCPGGEILPSTEKPGFLCVNGASPAARDGAFANSGLVVTLEPSSFGADPRAGMALQEHHEAAAFRLGGGDFGAPGQRVTDFLARRVSQTLGPTSYPLPVRPALLDEVLPDGAAEALRAALTEVERRMPGYAGAEAMLVGPESRSSAPLRIARDEHTLESPSHPGLYPVGEGAGHAGGIMSAAVDGLRVAEALALRFAPGAVAAE